MTYMYLLHDNSLATRHHVKAQTPAHLSLDHALPLTPQILHYLLNIKLQHNVRNVHIVQLLVITKLLSELNLHVFLPTIDSGIIEQHTTHLEVSVDEIERDVDGDERPRTADAGATVHEQRARVVQQVQQLDVLYGHTDSSVSCTVGAHNSTTVHV